MTKEIFAFKAGSNNIAHRPSSNTMDAEDLIDLSSSSRTNTTVDPLMEQMRSILRLGPRASDASQRRERRFSDADRPQAEIPTARPEPIAIRSRDGSRWLPAPDEQSHRVGLANSSTISRSNPSSFFPLEQHVCQSAICAVAKVFETTELLELILSFLETKEILALRLSSRRWDSIIHDSPQLRLHFFTYGQWSRPGAKFQLLPLNLPGLSIEKGENLHLGQWIIISFTREAARRIAPDPRPSRRVRSRSIFEGLRGGLGSRAQKSSDTWPATTASPTINSTLQYDELFVSQPPLLGMQAFIIYASNTDEEVTETEDLDPDTEVPACAKLSCDAGITLGFLAETAQQLLASQKAGPSNVEDARVVFKAIISFCAAEQTPRQRRNTRTVIPIHQP